MTTTTARARREPTQQRNRRTVRQILDAAEQIVGTQGMDAATTRAIAERAGVAIPSLYRFFADRDEILDALAEHMTADLDQHARAAEASWQPGDPRASSGSSWTPPPPTSKPTPAPWPCGSAAAYPRQSCRPSAPATTTSPSGSGPC